MTFTVRCCRTTAISARMTATSITPGWCKHDDCVFWERFRYRSPRWRRKHLFSYDRRPLHIRAWRKLKDWARDYNPIALARWVEGTGWGDHEDGEWYHATSETRVADMVLRRWNQCVHTYYALFGKWDLYDAGKASVLVRALYRLKAVICIVLGWEPRSRRAYYLEGFAFTAWDVREYGTMDGPGGSCERLHVGYGFGNWFAYVEHESWP